ncbi:MAG: HAD family phosphatase [Candidatus Micrarchaeota archaeon]|nr:HAD family phosphatase [Candidatus Micrarchaeota archaeon]MDE1847648.1 HAD family phosphatase [Candidatus Micrarchaeota archaeon]MDE1864469.1 HAD family phosphatase [Candidatus Micrarchaeota archaeon]
MKQKIKLLATDFDGTLAIYDSYRQSAWNAIAEALGMREEDEKLHDAYHKGEFDIVKWGELTIELYRQRGLTKDKMAQILSERMHPSPGAQMLFKNAKDLGLHTAIISGGLQNVYELFTKKLEITPDYSFFAHKFLFDTNGLVTKSSLTNNDYHGKVKVLEGLCDKLGVGYEECAFVGDAINDIPLFKVVGLPIAINAVNDDVKSAAKIVLKTPDLGKVLELLR